MGLISRVSSRTYRKKAAKFLLCIFSRISNQTHINKPKIIKMSEDKSDKKPEGGVEHVNLKVCGQDGSVVQIKKNTQRKKLMSAYCDRQGLDSNQIRFRFDGTPIQDTDTPTTLDMEDDDTIDVFQEQTGGM